MSFSDDVKEELLHTECTGACCAFAEITAAILLGGALSFRGQGRYGITLRFNRMSASRYYFSLVKKYMSIVPGIRTSRFNRLGEQTQVELAFTDRDVPQVMETLKLYDDSALFGVANRPAPEIIQKSCCRAAFLKSAFLMTGSVSNPEKEYSLTMNVAGEEAAHTLISLCADADVNAKMSLNRSRYAVYVKSAEGVSILLTLMGASAARLKLENVRILKDIKNSTNRQTNCDSNNIERSINTSYRQAEDIRFLARKLGSEKLPPWASEIMSLRLEHPDSSLQELGELCDPPIGKSGANNRLRRISELARQLRQEEP